MFLQFFTSLRDAQVPVTLREYLTLMEALDADLAEQTVENFYYLSRTSLVKDERNLDKFDRVFGTVFKGLESLLDAMEKADIPAEWLKKLAEKYLTEEEKKQIEAMGWDKLMETLRQRLKEQKGRHQGGNKWIGTAGTSPFGAQGYNPEGVPHRPGEEPQLPRGEGVGPARVQGSRRQRRTRHPQHQDRAAALAQIRPHRRAGRTRSRHHDQGDRQPRLSRRASCAPNGATRSRCWCSSISAARWIRISSRSRNCFPRRRPNSSTWNISTSTTACMRASGSRTAAASPTGRRPGTCCINIRTTTRWSSSATPRCRLTRSWCPAARSSTVNEEAGSVWLDRIDAHLPHAVWLNPVAQKHWDYSESTTIIRRLFSERMFPITIEGLEGAMKELVR